MPTQIFDNPFMRVYDAVSNVLLGATNPNALSALIKIGNRMTLTSGAKNPIQSTFASADVPNLLLIDEGGQANLHANSSGTSYLQYLSIYASTGSWDYGLVSTINWFVMCNMAQLRTATGAVTWKGLNPVKDIALVPIQTLATNPQEPKVIAGFTLVWRMQIDLRFPISHLTYTE